MGRWIALQKAIKCLGSHSQHALRQCIGQRSPAAMKKISDQWRALNSEAEMKDLAAKAGFELVNVGVEEMPAFMAEKTKLYTEGAARLGLGKK
jgi:hypothetical protein